MIRPLRIKTDKNKGLKYIMYKGKKIYIDDDKIDEKKIINILNKLKKKKNKKKKNK